MYARMRLSGFRVERKGWAWLLFVLFFASLPTSCSHSGGIPSSTVESSGVVERMPIYVAPFYNAEGPQVAVGKYSDELAHANADTIATTVATMKSEWDKLRPEAMYVAAICLFDLGLKDEAVYWYYSAQYRARLLQSLLGPEPAPSVGSEAFELGQTYDAFMSLAGIYIHRYAMGNPRKLADTVARVRTEGMAIPDFTKLYPDVEFVNVEKWPEINEEVRSGITDLLEMLEEHAAAFPNGMPEDGLNDEPGKPNARHTWPDSQVAALATAAQDGDVAEIDRLVAAGVDVNTKGLGCTTPLYWALRNLNKAGYKRLLEHGASPNVETTDGDSVMHFAAGWIEPEWLELALQHGGALNLPRSRCRRFPNRTPIFDAIGKLQTKQLQLLIDAGANVNQKDHEGQTPLTYAIRHGQYESAYQLLEAGADYRVKSPDGKDIATLIRKRASNPDLKTDWLDKVFQFITDDAAKDAMPVPAETDVLKGSGKAPVKTGKE